MGSQWSMGVVREAWRNMTSMDLEEIQAKWNLWMKMAAAEYDNPGILMNYEHFLKVFGLSKTKGHTLFEYMESDDGMRQATAAEVFGAIILLSKVDINHKIAFMFTAMDRNYDRHINRTELYMAMLLATRGVARLKRVAPPPIELLHELVGKCFGHEEVQLNTDGEVSNRDVIMWCKADDSVREYLVGLTQQKSTDIAGLYRQQEKILLKLAEIDARMYDMSQDKAEVNDDTTKNKAERGGDARDGLIVEMHVDDDDLDDFSGDEIEVAHLDQMGPKKVRERRRGQMLGMTFEVETQRDPATVAQEQRRSKRRFKIMVEANEATGGNKTKDAGAFKVNYKRVQGTSSANNKNNAVENPLLEQEKLIQNSWDQAAPPENDDGYMHLDLDTFLDIIEATGVLLPDKEALEALEKMPKNQLGQINLGSVLLFWRERDRLLKLEEPTEWKKRFMVVRDYLRSGLKRWSTFKGLLDLQSKFITTQQDPVFRPPPPPPPPEPWEVAVTEAEAALKAAEATEDPEAIATAKTALEAANSTAMAAANEAAAAKAEEAAAVMHEEPRVAHIGIAATIGHMVAPKAQIIFEILGAGLEAPGMAQPKRGEGGESTKFDITASEMLTFQHRSLPKTASENRKMKTAFWLDFVPDINATDYWVKQSTFQLEKAFKSIPQDYSSEFFDHMEAKMYTAGIKKPERLVRLSFYKRDDLIGDLEEAAFGEGSKGLSGVLDRLSAIFDCSATSADILKVAHQYDNLSQKCYGPQDGELEELAEPIRFAKLMKERREAAEKYKENAGTLTTKQIKTMLMEHGYRDRGTRQDMVERLQKIMEVKLDLLGFGELSRFGENVARNVFRRCDDDDDRALNFVEFTKMCRMLGMLPQSGENEYATSVQDLGYAANRKGYLKEEGLVAYYEKHGRLAEDAAKCGVGSLDEVCSGMLSITGEVDAKAMLELEPKWELNTFVNRLPKALTALFLGGKDVFCEMEYERISDLFVSFKDGAPKWLTEPGGLLRRIYDLQEWLADGHAGVIVDLRHAMLDVFGDEWKASKKADWVVQQAVKIDKKKKKGRKGRRKARRGRRKSRVGDGNLSARSGGGDAPTTARSGKSEASGASGTDGDPMTSRSGATTARSAATSAKTGATTARSEVSESDGAPMTARSGVSDAASEKSGKSAASGNDEEKAEEDESSFAWQQLDVGLPIGYSKEIAKMKDEAFRTKKALSMKMSKRERSDMEELLEAKIKTIGEMEERLQQSSDVCVAHLIRAYDAVRGIMREVRRVQFGNSRITFRFGMEGFEFLQFLPAGLGEAATRRAESERRAKIARERVEKANEFIKEERKRRKDQKEAAILKALEERAAQKRVWDDEERFLYISGQRNRKGKIWDVAEEKWRKVLNFVRKRRGPTATTAVAEMNMAILLFENHENDVTRWMECRTLMTSSLKTFDQYMKRVRNRRNGIDDQPGQMDNSDSEDEVEDERLRVKEESPPEDVDMKVVRALLLNTVLFVTLELDELEEEARRIQQAEKEATEENSDNSDFDRSSSEEEQETEEQKSNKLDPLMVHPQIMKIVDKLSAATMATVEFEITVHSVGMARYGDFPPDNIEDILERLRSRNKVEEVYDDSAERERARLRELRRLERIRKRKLKRAKKLLKISIPSADLKYDEEIVEYDGLRRISQVKYLEFVALVDEDKADRLRGRMANKEELKQRKARMAKLQAAQKERALLLAHERARKWGINKIPTDVARDSDARNKLNELLKQLGIIESIMRMGRRIKERMFGAPNSDDDLSADEDEDEHTIDGEGNGEAAEARPKLPMKDRAIQFVTNKRDNVLFALGLKEKKTDSASILAAMRGRDEYSDSDSD